MTAVAIAVALVAALCYAVGAALEQQQAVSVGGGGVVSATALGRLARRPRWWAGIAVATFGAGLHALALLWAPLAVVQPLGVTTLVFAVPLAALLRRRRPHAGELGAALVTSAGLAGLLATLSTPAASPQLSSSGVLTLAAGTIATVGLLVLAARAVSGVPRTLLLAAGTATTFAVTSALVRVLVHRIASDGLSGLLGWVSVAVALSAVGGLLVEQGTYRSGRLPAAVAVMIVVDPLVAVSVGAGLLHQPVSVTSPALAAAAAVAVLAGVAALARADSNAQERSRPETRPETRPERSRGALRQPQTSSATSTISASLATCSSSVRSLPSTVEENPH